MGAFDGNGNFIRSYTWVLDAANGLFINANRMDTEDTGFASGLSLCVTRDGQGKMSTDFLPNSDNTLNLGTGARRWASINGVPIGSITTGIFIATTTAEISAGITPTVFTYFEGDIRRYGATIASADNHVAINAALSVSAAGGNAAFIPGGTWAYTTTITASGSSCMYGVGTASILAPNGCDGLSFGIQGAYAASRFMRDFLITGTATGANNGIIVNFTAASGNKIIGMQFSNITIQNFQQAIFLRGLWNSVFRDIFCYNNYQGIYLHGQSIGNVFNGGFVQKGALAGAGTQYGVLLDSVAGESAQSNVFMGFGAYAYDVGISITLGLDTVISGCNMDFVNQVGIQVITVQGGTVIRDNWIQTNNAGFATVGVQIQDRGAAAQDKIVVEGNELQCALANAGSLGIYIGANQLGVTCNSNTVGTATQAFVTGISIVGKNAVSKFNTIYATTTAILVNSSATGVEIGPNVVQNGTGLSFSSLTPQNFSYFAQGTFAVTLTGMASGGTGTATWRASGGVIQLTMPAAGITGTSNATTMTMTGLPQWLWPNTDVSPGGGAGLLDAGANTNGLTRIAAATGLVTFFKDLTGAVFTNTGSKGLSNTIITYCYD